MTPKCAWSGRMQASSIIRRAVKKFPEFLWLKKCDNWFNMIEEWPSWNCNKKLASLTDPFMRFCAPIWRWDLSVRGLFRVVSASRWCTEPHIACCAAIPCRAKAFLSSPNHCTLQISFRVTLSCSLLWKWASRGRVSHPWRISNRTRQPNSGRFQNKPFAGASNNGRIDGASVCVCVCVCARARVLLWRWLAKRCNMSYN